MKSILLFTIITMLLVIQFDSNAQEAAQKEYIVRTVYFLPKDREVRQGIDASISDTVQKVQKFYADYMEKYGFGRKTFKYEPDANGNVLIHHVISCRDLVGATRGMPKGIHTVDLQVATGRSLLPK